MYYVQTIIGDILGVRPYGNYKFIEELLKSDKGWRLSYFIVIDAYEVFPKLGSTPT